jgi:hypothetical protein
MPSPRPVFLKRLGRRAILDTVLALGLGFVAGALLGYFGV